MPDELEQDDLGDSAESVEPAYFVRKFNGPTEVRFVEPGSVRPVVLFKAFVRHWELEPEQIVYAIDEADAIKQLQAMGHCLAGDVTLTRL